MSGQWPGGSWGPRSRGNGAISRAQALGSPGEVQFQSLPSAARQELHELACLLGPAPAHLDLDLYERALLFSSALRVGLACIYPPWAPALIGPCPSGHLYLRPLTLAWLLSCHNTEGPVPSWVSSGAISGLHALPES